MSDPNGGHAGFECKTWFNVESGLSHSFSPYTHGKGAAAHLTAAETHARRGRASQAAMASSIEAGNVMTDLSWKSHDMENDEDLHIIMEGASDGGESESQEVDDDDATAVASANSKPRVLLLSPNGPLERIGSILIFQPNLLHAYVCCHLQELLRQAMLCCFVFVLLSFPFF